MNIPFKECNSTNYRKGRNSSIKYIVIHYTANNGDTASGNASYFSRTANLQSSAHYFVDENEIYQSVREADTAWHCGATLYVHPVCRNDNSIGIEICSRKDSSGNYYFKDEAIKNAVDLTKELMQKYNVPIENVIRHYDVTGKICPAPFVNNVSKWFEFKNALTKEESKEIEEDKTINEVEEMRYQKLKDVPAGEFHDVIKYLIDKGVISGYSGSGEETEVDLSLDMVRMFVINYRVGLYK